MTICGSRLYGEWGASYFGLKEKDGLEGSCGRAGVEAGGVAGRTGIEPFQK